MAVEDTTPKNPEVLNKYQTASDIANRALKLAISKCQAGTPLSKICHEADEEIQQLASKVYAKQKGLRKGVAFPTAISVNNILCHVAPMEGDAGDRVLQEGDLAKIELGVHIDGYPALVCHSLVVGSNPVEGRKADLLQAAHLATEASIRMLREGSTPSEIRKTVLAICKDHGVAPIEGMMGHAVGKDSLALEGLSIVFAPTDVQARNMQDGAFENYQVWCVDVAVSLGAGKVQPLPEQRCTIWSRNNGVSYALRLKGSRALLAETGASSSCMAFHLRSLQDQVRARMALQECCNHQVMQSYEVQGEKAKEDLTARFMFTAAVMPAGPLKLTDHMYDAARVKADATVSSPELKALLDAPIRPKKK